ncbi:MAG: hypothetical protein U0Q16_24685 [Bryobacteraceae bacterium]
MKFALSLLFAAAMIVAAPLAAQNVPITGGDMVFDVRNGDQSGKLMLKDTEVAFESLTDSRHSRNWKYADIRELSRNKSQLRIKPNKGDTYDFQFKDKKVRDQIYDTISSRILAARQGGKR